MKFEKKLIINELVARNINPKSNLSSYTNPYFFTAIKMVFQTNFEQILKKPT